MTTYQGAGIDLEGAERHVSEIAEAVVATWAGRVVGELGGFAAGIELPPGYRHPVLMMTTDGVGTKLELARRAGNWDGVGFDLVAMCVDDLATAGALPIGFVDYMAIGSLDPARDTAIVESIAAACAKTDTPLLGGETAIHPGVMEPDAVDLAGAALGVVERDERLGSHRVVAGDKVVGLHSPNLRSNGFSLIRALFRDDLEEHLEPLLEPSVIYSPRVLAAAATGAVHSAAHITGGGLAANLARSLPTGLGAVLDTRAWEPPQVFDLVAERGVGREEMFSTFNMGIGFCLVVAAERVEEVMSLVGAHSPTMIGEITPGRDVTLR